jgi:hypothetical protein
MPRQKTKTPTRSTAAAKKPIAAKAPAAKKRTKAAPVKAEIPAVPTPPEPSEVETLEALARASAEDMYQREKQRRAGAREIKDPLAEARREYQALLASEAGTPRGGRPRKVRPKKSELSLEDSLDEFKGSEGEHEDE